MCICTHIVKYTNIILYTHIQSHTHTGEVYGRYVPQSVSNKDGQAQDVDIVLNEIFSDNEDVMVEFSNGPQPYRVRCGTHTYTHMHRHIHTQTHIYTHT